MGGGQEGGGGRCYHDILTRATAAPIIQSTNRGPDVGTDVRNCWLLLGHLGPPGSGYRGGVPSAGGVFWGKREGLWMVTGGRKQEWTQKPVMQSQPARWGAPEQDCLLTEATLGRTSQALVPLLGGGAAGEPMRHWPRWLLKVLTFGGGQPTAVLTSDSTGVGRGDPSGPLPQCRAC